ncbi:hypothetical protein KI387_034647, partial [Taxus chinensis]
MADNENQNQNQNQNQNRPLHERIAYLQDTLLRLPIEDETNDSLQQLRIRLGSMCSEFRFLHRYENLMPSLMQFLLQDLHRSMIAVVWEFLGQGNEHQRRQTFLFQARLALIISPRDVDEV